MEVRRLCKSFGSSQVLTQVSFQVAAGEFVAIMGRSGCGKSTLLYCASGMDRPASGEVCFDGRALSALSDREMERLRLAHMGFIFQKPNFLKNLSIADNIIFPAFQLGRQSRGEIVKEAQRLMERLGVLPVADHDIRQVSGGQLQRAAICRAMINHPDILFGDEPTGALNSAATKDVLDIIGQINRDGAAVLLVTHDAKVAARADRVIYLEDGQVKDILRLGTYQEAERPRREQTMQEWLGIMKF